MKAAVLAHHVAPIRPPFAGGVESVTWYLARWGRWSMEGWLTAFADRGLVDWNPVGDRLAHRPTAPRSRAG